MMKDILDNYCDGINNITKNNLSFLVEGIIRGGTASPWHASRSMSTDQSFKTNENLNIQIGDKCLNLSDFDGKNAKFTGHVFKWAKEVHFKRFIAKTNQFGFCCSHCSL